MWWKIRNDLRVENKLIDAHVHFEVGFEIHALSSPAQFLRSAGRTVGSLAIATGVAKAKG